MISDRNKLINGFQDNETLVKKKSRGQTNSYRII